MSDFTESLTKPDRRAITVLERYSMEVMALAIFGMLSWVGYTTYQNALTLNTISAKFEGFATLTDRLGDKVAENSAVSKALEIRVQRLEDTRWSRDAEAKSTDELKEWVEKFYQKKEK